MPDIALRWQNEHGAADMVVNAGATDLVGEEGLETAILLSLFLDRRAEEDDDIPSDDGDRRGWWGSQFLTNRGDQYGSRLWLLARGKRTANVARDAELYCREALAWLVEDAVVDTFDVAIELTAIAILIAVTVYRPDRDPTTFRYEHVWVGEAAKVR